MNKKILIIEDEKVQMDMYRTRFEKAGFKVITARNGKPGLELAKRQRPDLILLDIVMPLVNGFRVLEKLKKDTQVKDIPIVILSNLSQKEEIEKGLKLGAEEYIVKTSLTPSQIVEKIKARLGL